MRDRRNGIGLLVLAAGMVLYGVVDLARDMQTQGFVEIGLGVAGLVLGVVLVRRSRRP
jgi:hypothetical protein